MNILRLTQFLSTTKGGGEYVFSVMANAQGKKANISQLNVLSAPFFEKMIRKADL